MTTPQPPPFQTALIAGALAGTTVDLSLFPLDTLKTRLQSHQGFFAAGGFRGIYRGVGSALVGSAPGAAFFFCTYEATKSFLLPPHPDHNTPVTSRRTQALTHMLAASAGEIAACAIRVPTEVVKQRAQAGQFGGSSAASLLHILRQRGQIGVVGVWRELYRGWSITVMREVPFTILQFPLWEGLKAWGRERKARLGRGVFGDVAVAGSSGSKRIGGSGSWSGEVGAAESALYGSISGGAAAAVTTPLDVIKTRVMLSAQRESIASVVRTIWEQHGIRPFFAGIGPRVMWISAGGAIFLGSYQWAVNALERSRLVI